MLAVVAFLALTAVVAVGLRGVGRSRYVREQTLFSATEWAFLRALDEAVGGRYRVFGKVRIADLMTPSKKGGRKAWWRAFTQISSKHVDFVLVDLRTAEIVAAIEVDDRSHARKDRSVRDTFVDRAFQDSGIPLIRFPAKGRGGYRVADIRNQLGAALSAAYGAYA